MDGCEPARGSDEECLGLWPAEGDSGGHFWEQSSGPRNYIVKRQRPASDILKIIRLNQICIMNAAFRLPEQNSNQLFADIPSSGPLWSSKVS